MGWVKTPRYRKWGRGKETSVYILCECLVLEKERTGLLGRVQTDLGQLKDMGLNGHVTFGKRAGMLNKQGRMCQSTNEPQSLIPKQSTTLFTQRKTRGYKEHSKSNDSYFFLAFWLHWQNKILHECSDWLHQFTQKVSSEFNEFYMCLVCIIMN